MTGEKKNAQTGENCDTSQPAAVGSDRRHKPFDCVVFTASQTRQPVITVFNDQITAQSQQTNQTLLSTLKKKKEKKTVPAEEVYLITQKRPRG